MKKRTKTTFSLILVVCSLLSVLSGAAPVAAVEADQVSTSPIIEAPAVVEDGTTVTDNAIAADVSILAEEVSLRREYEKHFLMSDGSYQVALYNEPVHKMEDGEWVEIDNTLALQTATDGTAQYATANGLTDVSFAQNFDDQLVTMRQDDYSVSWGVQAVSDSLNMNTSAELVRPVQAELVTADLSAFNLEEQKTLAVKSSSTIQYRNALRQNVDLEYIVLPSRIKENIILQSAQDISYYVVTVYVENLSARLLENREIEFYNDSDEVIFTMTSPYMYDSVGELSEDITIEMVSKGSGCYFIKMTPDGQWLDDENRVYPVVIDPQVSVDTTRTNIIDNYVLKDSGVQNRNLDRLYIGQKSDSIARAFIKYDTMPTIPSGSTITAATMTLTFTNGTDTAANASAYKVTGGDWASGTITWANMPAAATALATNISHNNLTGYSFSCKTAVQSWYSGSTTGNNANYGIMLRYYNETIADYNAVYSADYTDESKRPTMVITYQPPSDSIAIDEGDTYTLSVSNASGTITWTSGDTSVATVSSSGVVTGIRAGKATVTAYVGGTIQKTFTVYVTVADGVYRICYSNLYLGTDGSIAENTAVRLLAYTSDDTLQLYQLWKITYIGNGYYSIRPLFKLDMALHATSNNVDITNTGKSDSYSTVSSLNRWSIIYGATGYNINHVGTSSMAMRPAGGALSPGLGVITAINGTNAAIFNWGLQPVDEPPSGIRLYEISTEATINFTNSRYIAAGTTKTLEDLDFAAYAYSGNPATTETITWSCTSGSSYLSINSSTGTISALSPGTALITGSSRYGSFKLYVTVTGSSTTDFTFINHYDSSFMEDSELVGFIDDAVSFVNTAYQRQFSVSFSSSTDPYYRTKAITDDCTLRIRASCHEGDECEESCNTAHHKNIYRISDHFYSSTIPQDHIAVFWTDRDTTSYCYDDIQTIGWFACVYKHRPVIHMMSIDYISANRVPCMAINLAHETAHTLGLREVRDEDPSHELYGGWTCAMEAYEDDTEALLDFYNGVLNGDISLFCTSCKAEIDELLASYT